MTAVNFTKPVTSDLRADVLQFIRNYMDGQAKLFDGDTLTATPTGAIRYSGANSRFERWGGSSWAALPLGFLPAAGGAMTGALEGTSANFTAGLSVGGQAVWHAGNLTPANYLPLLGGTLAGVLNTVNVLPTVANASTVGSAVLPYAGVYAANFYESGVALTSKYALAGHSHSFLPLTGGTLSGTLTGQGASFTSLTVGGSAVSVAGHTHPYLSTGGGSISGNLAISGWLAAGATQLQQLELGHGDDTSFARIAAGRASLEGREIVTLAFAASSAKFSRGTADPTGGEDGDFYFQYT